MVAHPTRPLDAAIRSELELRADVLIDWRSPNDEDDRAEYRDGRFLDLLDLNGLRDDLARFWPRKGPQWDALGVASDGKVLLVEAKAHPGEMASTCTAGAESRELIVRSLDTAKRAFGAIDGADWIEGFYQYANRLAHLQFLRERGVDAHLIFVYFLNDREMRGPASAIGWANAIDECHTALGLPEGRHHEGLHSIFIDVAKADVAALAG